MIALKLQRLPRGGKCIRIRLETSLSRFDLVATVIHAAREESEITRRSCRRYLRHLMENHGVEGFITLYNEATDRQRQYADNVVSDLFPEFR